jgi:hypothetical protein
LAVGPAPAELNGYVGATHLNAASVPALVTAAHVDLVRAVRDEHLQELLGSEQFRIAYDENYGDTGECRGPIMPGNRISWT